LCATNVPLSNRLPLWKRLPHLPIHAKGVWSILKLYSKHAWRLKVIAVPISHDRPNCKNVPALEDIGARSKLLNHSLLIEKQLVGHDLNRRMRPTNHHFHHLPRWKLLLTVAASIALVIIILALGLLGFLFLRLGLLVTSVLS